MYYSFRYANVFSMLYNVFQAELRANVFQAMEEQDHEAESNGSTTFSLLGTCSERAKKLHTSSSGMSYDSL